MNATVLAVLRNVVFRAVPVGLVALSGAAIWNGSPDWLGSCELVVTSSTPMPPPEIISGSTKSVQTCQSPTLTRGFPPFGLLVAAALATAPWGPALVGTLSEITLGVGPFSATWAGRKVIEKVPSTIDENEKEWEAESKTAG